MSKLSAALAAALCVTSAVAGTPAWAERGFARHDRGHPVYQSHAANHRGHPVYPSHAISHRGHGGPGWAVGLGLLAGTAILLSATESRTVIAAPPVVVYPSRPTIYLPPAPVAPAYSNPNTPWWYYCAQPAGYYPYINQCSTGWARVAPRPPG